jgi:hypothetical protein
MKYIIIATLISNLLFFRESHSQGINWAESKNWRLYNILDNSAFGYPLDSLVNYSSRLLNKDSMQTFLSNVSIISIEKTPLWMGFYVASCELKNGTSRKIEISTYGGFFYDELEKKYYQLPLEIRKDWLDYLAESEAALQVSQN